MTHNTTQSQNDYFFEFFQERVDFVKSNCMERIEGMILLCSYLDSLAGYRYGGISSAVRFNRFLINDTEQSDTWSKVSLILLRQYLEKKNLSLYSNLVNILNRLGAKSASFVNLNYNPDISLESLMDECRTALSAEEMQSCIRDLKRFEYTAILWNAYRNASIHETAVRLNQAMNIANRTKPFYSNEEIIHDRKIVSTFTRFGIPPHFLVVTLESGLSKLKKLVSSGECNLSLSAPYDEP